MILEILKFELKYRVKRLDTYLYFFTLLLFSMIGVDFVFAGVDLGAVAENSPYVIAFTMAALSGIFLMITSMVCGVAVLRDYEHQMESLIFVNPMKKRDYLFGRFLGSFLVVVIIFSALIWGLMLGEYMPWRETDYLLPFYFWKYLQPFIFIVLPILFCGSAVFFASGALSRNLIVVYTQGIIFFVILILSKGIENEFAAAVLDPFSIAPIKAMVGIWTPAEKNAELLPIGGVLFYNRILWMILGLIALCFVYIRFQFSVVKDKASKKQIVYQEEMAIEDSSVFEIPVVSLFYTRKVQCIQLLNHALFYFKSLLKEPSFWAIVICGAIILFVNSINLETAYGVNAYPKTYLIIEELQEMSSYFFLIILVFYSGELIWKERALKFDQIYDSYSMSNFVILGGKFLGLILTFVVLILFLILSGILFQTFSGYYQFELDVYFAGFFIEVLPFLMLFTLLAFFVQVIVNYKFIGYLITLVLFILTLIIQVSGYGHNLYIFGGSNLGTYSDMNGYGHFLQPYLWYKFYWLLFGVLMFVVATLFLLRGKETGFKNRLKLAKQNITKPLMILVLNVSLVFVLTGAYIFYNTNILNEHWPISRQESFLVAYEKTLKKFEFIPQPKVIGVNLNVELYPKERNYTVEGYYQLVNKSRKPISEIHVQKRVGNQIQFDYLRFSKTSKLQKKYEAFDYYIYDLDIPLQVGDSIKMEFKQTFTTQGFEEGGSDTRFVYNGTFFNNDEFPSLGYSKSYELRNEKDRINFDLPPRPDRAKIEDVRELRNARSGDDGYVIDFEMTIGTDANQTAIAPGYLKKEWTEDGRNYFHYKMDQPIANLYSVVSAEYEVTKDQWVSKDSFKHKVDLEIFYHKGHDYNLGKMQYSMKKSFDYFSENFSPYQYDQMRIMEVPRYIKFAMSCPNTVPFSESIGFIMNVDEKDVDMPFYVTAHELAHQWWGIKVVAANVEGKKFLLESLAQYSALMVLKENFDESKVIQFLEGERKKYFKGRSEQIKQEVPLSKVGKQDYIAYRKGGINLYALQYYISEDSVNMALKRFIRDWNIVDGVFQKERYATSEGLLFYLKEVTPDSLQYLVEDLFEKVILYDNKIKEANFVFKNENKYQVNLTLEGIKYQTDSIGVESEIEMNDWIDIGIYGEDENGVAVLIYLKKHKIIKGLSNIQIEVDQKPIKAVVDPKQILLDKDVLNNRGGLVQIYW